jgi:hypothetical protein
MNKIAYCLGALSRNKVTKKAIPKSIYIQSPESVLGVALKSIATNLGTKIVSSPLKEEKVDCSILLNENDNVKSAWRVLSPNGRVVVMNGSPGIAASKFVFAVGLSIFANVSMHGYSFSSWLEELNHDECELLLKQSKELSQDARVSAAVEGITLTAEEVESARRIGLS